MTTPPGSFLTAEWRYLAILSYEVEPAILRSRIPEGTELDDWRGKTIVSIVAFLFRDTRVRGWPIPFHRNFEEANLRFYVRRRGEEGLRRGVVFVKEIVPRWATAAVARWVYGERYVAMPMRHRLDLEAGVLRPGGTVEYAWRHRGRWSRLRVTAAGPAEAPAAGSEEAFVTEHYWGYAGGPGRRTIEYRVEHPPWRVFSVGQAALDGDVAALCGPELAAPLSAAPSSALVAEGSPVVVGRGRRIPGLSGR